MSRRSFARFAVPAAILAVLLGVGLASFLRNRWEPEGHGRSDRPGFHEGAEEAGITFKMLFMPGEQGEKFKGNLYDHGCGLAIADVDGDGHDDLYFTNQLGRNALYRNNGNGTFTDITDKAGVGVG